MAKVLTLDSLFVEEIRDLYDAEKQLTKALPKMATAAASEELRTAFEDHLKETQQQVERLEHIFKLLDQRPAGKKCAAMTGLIKEGEDVVVETSDTAVRDAGLITAAQKVEHYEMSGYGSARSHAQLLGYFDAASLIEQTLSDEKEADRKLNDLAEKTINEEAMNTPSTAETARSRRPSKPTTRTAGEN